MRSFHKYEIGCVIAAMIILPLVGFGVAFYLRGEPYRAAARALPAELAAAKAEHIPLTPADMERAAPVQDKDNAALLYAQLYQPAGIGAAQKDVALVIADRATAAQRRSASKQVAAEAAQFTIVEQAASLPHCDFHRKWAQGPDLTFPEHGPMRHMAQMLAVKATLECDDGDPEAALRTIGVCARMTRHLGEEPIMMAALVRIAIEAVISRAFVHVIDKYAGRDDILHLAASTDREFGDLPDIRFSLSGEPVLYRIAMASVAHVDLGAGTTIERFRTRVSREVLAQAYEQRAVAYWRRHYAVLRRTSVEPMATYIAMKAFADADSAVQSDRNGNPKPTYEGNAVVMVVYY